MGAKRLKIDLAEYETMKKTIEELESGKIECKIMDHYYAKYEFLTSNEALIKASETNDALREVIKQQAYDLKNINNQKKTKRSFFSKWF